MKHRMFGRTWRPADIALLRQLCADGADMNTAVRQLRRTTKAIENKAHRLRIGHASLLKAPSEWLWTDEQIAELVRCWPDGEPSSEIGRRIGRDAKSVNNKARALGLAPRAPKQGGRPRAKPIVELPRQAAAWSGIVFTDSPIAMRPEAPLRGLPPINASMQSSCAGALAAAM